jgi:uncharacterized protein YbjT (DUF2867 family)
MHRKALIFGSTGLTGSQILHCLCESEAYDEVAAFVRRSTSVSHPKLKEYMVDFNNPESFEPLLHGDDIFLCMGTTIKKAGSKEAFTLIDYHYNLNAAKAASENGVKACYLISSVGADENLGNFYLSVKGKLEADLKKLNFRSIGIFRPSLLLGDRKEFRAGERIAALLSFLITPVFALFKSRYTPVEVSVLASFVVRTAESGIPGIHLYEYKDFVNH